MKFGLSILATEFGVQPFELAKQAESLGFESFFVPEHSHLPVSTVFPLGDEVPLPYKSMYDPFVTLGAVAAVTSKILGLPATPEYIDILMKHEVDRMILNIPNDSAAAAVHLPTRLTPFASPVVFLAP